MKKVFSAIIKYLSDWRNWLVHALVGIALLVAIIWVPVQWWIKIIALVCVITLNSIRMLLSAKRKKQNAQQNADGIKQPVKQDEKPNIE